MNGRTMAIGLLLSGFFALACIRASWVPDGDSTGRRSMRNLFRFPGRIERLRRSRWQWFALVSLMIVLRMQQQLPVALEIMAALQFVSFMAVPSRSGSRTGKRNPAAV